MFGAQLSRPSGHFVEKGLKKLLNGPTKSLRLMKRGIGHVRRKQRALVFVAEDASFASPCPNQLAKILRA